MADQLFIDTSGEVTPVAQADADGAARLGWVPASPKQVADYELQQKYGGTAEGAKAFGEHAASALTLGLSDVAERATGLSTPEAMRGREEVHPIASGAGTALGVAAPLVLSAGATAPSLIARAGEATSAAVRAGLPAGEGAVGRIVARAAASGAGSAIEGAAYGVGQVVHEAALGDPNLTAQSALATVGLSSILAGGLGFGGGFLAGALPEVLPKDLGAKVSDLLTTAEGHSNLNATNARPGEIRKVFTAKGEESATRLGVEARDLGILRNPFTDSPDSIAARAGAVKTEAGSALQRLVDEAAPAAPVTSFDAVRVEVEAPIVKALKSQGSSFAVGEQFESLLNRYAQAYEGRELDLPGVWKLKQDIGDFIYRQGKVIDPWARELNTPLKRVYDHLDQLVETGIRDASGADAAAQWTAANRGFEVASTMERLAQKGIERSAENNAVHLTGQVGAIAGIVAGGPVGGVALGAGSELVRRRGASALGWAARALRESIDGDAIGAVVNKTADAIASERAAGQDTIAQSATQTPARSNETAKTYSPNISHDPLPDEDGVFWRVHRKFKQASGQAPRAEQTAGDVASELMDPDYWRSEEWSGMNPDVREGLSAMRSPERLAKYMQDHGGKTEGHWLVKYAGTIADEADFDASEGVLLTKPTRVLSVEPTPEDFNAYSSGEKGSYRHLHLQMDDPPAAPIVRASPPEKVATLGLLERLNGQTARKIELGMQAVLRGAPRAGRGEVEAGIASVFGKSPEDARAAFSKRSAQVRQLASDPALMQSKLDSQTGDWQEHAPNTAQAMQITSARAVAFLASKLPATGGAGPLAGKLQPNRDQVSKFGRYYEAVQHPLGVLKQAAAGTLTPEAIEALQAVYPQIYEQMKAAAVARMGKASSIPYRQKLMLSMLVGQDLDGSMASAARNFALYAQRSAPSGPMAALTRGVPKAGKITLANRMLTPDQASAQRMKR